jgi:hypothetical protein
LNAGKKLIKSTNSLLLMKLGRIAILFGAGAAKSSWNPIIRVVEPYCRFHPATDDVANTFFASIVYQLRMTVRSKKKQAL